MKIRVLLVDDDRAVLLTLARALSIRRDIQVVGEASDGVDALDLATRVPADVIVMDERMPRMTGLEAVRRMREAGIDAPVLLFSADDGVDDRRDGLQNVHFLSKAREGFTKVPNAVRELAGTTGQGGRTTRRRGRHA